MKGKICIYHRDKSTILDDGTAEAPLIPMKLNERKIRWEFLTIEIICSYV